MRKKTNTKLREINQNLQKLRNNWNIRKKQNIAKEIQQNMKKHNVRAGLQRLNEQRPPIRKTKVLRDSNGEVHIDIQNKLRIATEYLRKIPPKGKHLKNEQ